MAPNGHACFGLENVDHLSKDSHHVHGRKGSTTQVSWLQRKNLLQCICMPNHHVVYVRYLTILSILPL